MAYQSEIRDSEINELIEKVQGRKYASYLLRINIEKARAFKQQSVSFDFPVTALVGPNGGGKTTILGAAGIAYATVKPAKFFAKSGRFDASMKEWKFEFELIDRATKSNDAIRRTASFSNYKWSRDGVARSVAIFGVSRTVPATEKNEMIRFTGGKFDVPESQIKALPKDAIEKIAKILDKDFKDFKFVSLDGKGEATLIAGQTSTGDAYSEFHFGAGESSIIRMVVQLETMPENSLVLIEEIENGLHPLATMRLVEYLIDLASRRKIQAIFTTHSNDAIAPLPARAIWAAVNGNIYQGKLDIASLRAISGQVDSKLVIFVEDSFAKLWVQEVLRTVPDIAIDAISIHAMQGDGIAVRVHKDHMLNPTTQQPSICILDGDSSEKTSSEDGIYRLPGGMPERYIFESVRSSLGDTLGELTVALLRPYETQEQVRSIIDSVANTNHDPHVIFSQVGKPLGLLPESRVKEAFLSTWARHFSNETQAFIDQFRASLPLNTTTARIGGKN